MASEPIPAPVADLAPEFRGALRVGRNFVYRVASQVTSSLVNVGAMILLGRALSADGYGQYAFYYAFVPLIASLSDSGIGIIVTREIARAPQNSRRWLGDAIMIKGAVSGTFVLLAAVLAPLFLAPAHALLVVLVTLAGTLDFGQDISIWNLRARERLDLEALLLMVSQWVWVAAIAASLFFHLGLAGLLSSAVLAFSIRLTVAQWILRKHFYRPQFDFDFARLRAIAAQGLPFGLALFGVVLYGRVGLILLRALASPADVSVYQVGFNLSTPFDFIATALCISMFPSLSRHAGIGHPSLGRNMRRAVKMQYILAFPLTVALFVAARPLIELFFHGRGFDHAATALRVLSLGLAVVFVHHVARYALAAIGRQAHYLKAVLVGIAVNAGLCAWWIPRFGFLGACVAFIVAEFAILGVCQLVLHRYVSTRHMITESLRPLAAVAIVVGLLYACRELPLMPVALVAAALYALLLWVFHALSADEIHVLRRVVQSFKPRPWGKRVVS